MATPDQRLAVYILQADGGVKISYVSVARWKTTCCECLQLFDVGPWLRDIIMIIIVTVPLCRCRQLSLHTLLKFLWSFNHRVVAEVVNDPCIMLSSSMQAASSLQFCLLCR
jgi:hypothetical protein